MLTNPLVLRLQVEQITQEQLEVVIADQEKPIVIDFFATWCGPCVMLAKELEKVGHYLTNTHTGNALDRHAGFCSRQQRRRDSCHDLA